MLLDNVRPDKDDRYNFFFRFVCRAWFLFLVLLFSIPVMEVKGHALNRKQFIILSVAFLLIVVMDYLGMWIKYARQRKADKRIDIQHHGIKKTR